MFLVELSKIIPNPDQPRKTFNEDSLRELANNIQEYGQIQPIVLKLGDSEDTYILAAGERRYRAHQLLGKTHIYAVLTDGGVDERLRRGPQDAPRDIQVPLAPSGSRRVIPFAATVLRSLALLR
jgi:ParB-like chromosome segregation protein Spo0J